MKKNILTLFLVLFNSLFLFSQTGTLNKALKSLAFINAQDKLINSIKNDSNPSEYNQFIYEYNAFFGDIKTNSLNYLKIKLPKDSLDNCLNQLEVMLGNINTGNVEPNTVIKTIRARIENLNGIPTDLKQALVFFKFYNNPGGAVSNGFYEKFTFSNPKSTGRNFSLKIPLFMENRSKNTDLVLSKQIFNYYSNLDDYNFTIGATNATGEYKKFKKTELEYISTSPEQMKNISPKNSKLLNSKVISGQNYIGILAEFDLVQEYLGITMNTKISSLYVFEQGQLFIFNFSYGEKLKTNSQNLSKLKNKYHNLILSVLNSLQFD
jgi:hypothetical protein